VSVGGGGEGMRGGVTQASRWLTHLMALLISGARKAAPGERLWRELVRECWLPSGEPRWKGTEGAKFE
jgi:hypothetical protein